MLAPVDSTGNADRDTRIALGTAPLSCFHRGRRLGRGMASRRSALTGLWIGGRVVAPVTVDELGDDRPRMSLWIEQPEGFVVYVELEDPREPAIPFSETLRRAMARPAVGSPRRPRRVRIADPALAEKVRTAFPSIAVEVAPTPEIAEVVRSFAEHGGKGGAGRRESYLEGGRVPAEAVGEFFRAAEFLHIAAPWRIVDGDTPFRLDVPQLGIEGACLSVIGNAGESFGFLLFDSIAAFTRFLQAAGERRDSRDLGGRLLSLVFEDRADVAAERLAEIEANGWQVREKAAVPLLQRRDRDGMLLPLGDDAYRLAARVAAALASFAVRRPANRSIEGELPVSESFSGNDDVEVRLTAPYEAWAAFQPIPEGRSDGPLRIDVKLSKRLVRLQEGFRDASRRLNEFIAASDDLQAEMLEASRYFFRGRNPFDGVRPLQVETALGRLAEWFALERISRARRCRPVESFLAEAPKSKSAAPLARLNQSVLDSFAVRDIDPGNGVVVESLMSGRRFEVFERTASAHLVPGAVAMGRLFPLDDRFWTFSPWMSFLDDPRAAAEIEPALAAIPPEKREPPSQRDLEDVLSGDARAARSGAVEPEEPRDGVEERLRTLLEAAGLDEDIDALRRRMSRAPSLTSLLEEVLAKGTYLDQEQIELTINAVSDLWNTTPRPELRGRSPWEAHRAQTPTRSAHPGPSRNAPCPCGSRRWYKRCCGRRR